MACILLKFLVYFGVGILYCYASDITSTKPRADTNKIELPEFNIHNLDRKHQKLAQQLKSFASEYAKKANEISKLPEKKKLKAGKKLEDDLMTNFKRMEPKIQELQKAPILRSRWNSPGQRSLMDGLKTLLQSVVELPMRIHCLIFGCPAVPPTRPTEPTTPKGSDESEYQ